MVACRNLFIKYAGPTLLDPILDKWLSHFIEPDLSIITRYYTALLLPFYLMTNYYRAFVFKLKKEINKTFFLIIDWYCYGLNPIKV